MASVAAAGVGPAGDVLSPTMPTETCEAEEEEPAAAAVKPLVFKSLDASQTDFSFSDGECAYIGRGSPPDPAPGVHSIVVTGKDAKTVSGVHCRIFCSPLSMCDGPAADGEMPDVFVQDLSMNGTFVGTPGKLVRIGKDVTKKLRPGDYICLLDPAQQPAAKLRWQLVAEPEVQDSAEARWGAVAKEYLVEKKLGSGNFAAVHLGIHRTKGTQVALKLIDKRKVAIDSDFSIERLREEVRLLQRLKHPNVVGIHGCHEDPGKKGFLCIVLELVPYGDFFDYLSNSDGLTENECKALFVQQLEALLYLHSQGIAHRDLKPENILLGVVDGFVPKRAKPFNQSGYSTREIPVKSALLKLADFGLAKWTGDRSMMKTYCGTPLYIAPEILWCKSGAQEGYTKLVDVWSIGIILFIMACKKLPKDPAKAGFKLPADKFKGFSEHIKDLLLRLLAVSPLERITMRQICSHPWLAGMTIKGRELAEDTPKHEAAAAASQTADPPSSPAVVKRTAGAKRTHSATSGSTSATEVAKRPRKDEPGAAAAAAGGAAGSDGDADTEPEEVAEGPATVQWEWKEDQDADEDEGWLAYTPEVQKSIEESYAKFLEGKKRCCRVPGGIYAIDFQNKLQWKLKEKNKQRGVRRREYASPAAAAAAVAKAGATG
eukprot:Hpha_TRINITY_DN29823_c0_g1::TRINITY_DN29823_c0_g1_i1::g.2967::m.2967/K06641/CHK2; serine/threonine-protein kinase Chk2